MPKIIGAAKVRFNLFDWNTADETYIILYYCYRKGKRLKFSTHLKIKPNDFDRVKMRAIHSKRFPESSRINERLNRLELLCKTIFNETNGKITVDDFRIELNIRLGESEREDGIEADPPTFLEFIKQQYNERASKVTAKKGSLQVLHKVIYHLEAYAKEKRRRLEFTQLNEKFYSDFQNWLHSPPRNLSTNYVQKIWQNVKYFIVRAENKHYHNDRTYREFKPGRSVVTKIALTFAQLETLAALDLSGSIHLSKARDLFLVGAYTGLRYSDFTRIQPAHILTHEGERLIQITTLKTGQTVHIPLNPVLEAVLQKYGYRSPQMTNQRMNNYLKEIGKMAGFTNEIIVNDASGGVQKEKAVPMWEMLTSHVARRSFATNYYHKHPELIDNIMKITGHTTEKMFRAYIVTDRLNSALEFAKAIRTKK